MGWSSVPSDRNLRAVRGDGLKINGKASLVAWLDYSGAGWVTLLSG